MHVVFNNVKSSQDQRRHVDDRRGGENDRHLATERHGPFLVFSVSAARRHFCLCLGVVEQLVTFDGHNDLDEQVAVGEHAAHVAENEVFVELNAERHELIRISWTPRTELGQKGPKANVQIDQIDQRLHVQKTIEAIHMA